MKEGASVKDGDSVFLDKPPKTLDEPPGVTLMLSTSTVGSHNVLHNYRDMIAIKVNGIQDVVFKDRVTKVPTLRPQGSPPVASTDPSSSNSTPDTSQAITATLQGDHH